MIIYLSRSLCTLMSQSIILETLSALEYFLDSKGVGIIILAKTSFAFRAKKKEYYSHRIYGQHVILIIFFSQYFSKLLLHTLTKDMMFDVFF